MPWTSWPSPEFNIGMGAWFANFAQYSLFGGPDSYNARSLATVTTPYCEYFIFCTFKSVQIASFIGGILIRPIYSNYLEKKMKAEELITNNTSKVIKAACRRLQGRILIGSFFASPLMMATSIYAHGYTPEKLATRCYQIRCDDNILTYDRVTFVFAWLGWYWKRFQGAADGINLALCYSIFHLKIAKPYLNPFNLNTYEWKGFEKYKKYEEAELEESEFYRFFKKKLSEKDNKGVTDDM